MSSGAAKPFGSLIPFGEETWSRGLPSPYYKESHERLRKDIRNFVENEIEILDNAHAWSEAGEVPPEVYQACARKGIIAAVAAGARIPDPSKDPYWKDIKLPGDVPHAEWDGFHDLIITEEMHRADFGCGMGILVSTSPKHTAR